MTFAVLGAIGGAIEGLKAAEMIVPGVISGCTAALTRNGRMDFASATIFFLGAMGAISGCYVGSQIGGLLDCLVLS